MPYDSSGFKKVTPTVSPSLLTNLWILTQKRHICVLI